MNLVTLKHKQKSDKNLDNSMIPAINIVFLLLIFFMIAGRIENRDMALFIPKSTSEAKFLKQEVDIKIMPNGEYYLNDKKLEDSLIEAFKLLSLTEESIVTCHIHNELAVSKLDPILEALKVFGIKRMNIATKRN